MKQFNWTIFLERWNQEALELIDKFFEEEVDEWEYAEQAFKRGTFLFPGATASQIKKLEDHLGIQLPSSYKAFLMVSNGWIHYNGFEPDYTKLFSTEEINWLHLTTEEKEITENWINELYDAPEDEVSDEDYFVYGEAQDEAVIRTHYLQTALAISVGMCGSVYLLNPQIITSNGEWEAWYFSVDHPGAFRYPSFQEMMEADYQRFRESYQEYVK